MFSLIITGKLPAWCITHIIIYNGRYKSITKVDVNDRISVKFNERGKINLFGFLFLIFYIGIENSDCTLSLLVENVALFFWRRTVLIYGLSFIRFCFYEWKWLDLSMKWKFICKYFFSNLRFVGMVIKIYVPERKQKWKTLVFLCRYIYKHFEWLMIGNWAKIQSSSANHRFDILEENSFTKNYKLQV